MASFPTDTFTGRSGDLDVFIPQVYGERINDFFKAKLEMAPFFTNRSDELSGGGDTLYTPGLTEMSASAKTNGAAVTLVSPTETRVTLTVNQWFEISFNIEDREAAQVKQSYALMTRYAQNAGYSIARRLDTAIASLFTGFSGSVGTSTTNVADSNIRAAIATIESANVNLDECAFFFHPAVFWNQLQAIDRFALAINSPVNDPSAKMPHGYLYGLPVYRTTQIQFVSGTTGRVNALAHPDAIHWAASALGMGGSKGSMVGAGGVRVQSNYIPEYLATLTTADILYGVVENRDEAGVRILSAA
jgi:hypothetical protein